MSIPALQCFELGLHLNGHRLVEGVELCVAPGETLGIVGPNGSGKSTLLNLLAGLRAPTSGRVELGGQPLARLKRRDIARQLALVEQQAETSDGISVRDAVELGRTPWLSALAPWSAEDDAIVAQALADTDMSHKRDAAWHSLSGGERQRVHIARALAQRPSLLLLDEPTNHLDIRHQLQIFALVRALPVTTVIALHDLNQALDCDRLAVMDRGRLVDLGAPEQVLTEQRLASTFGVRGRWLHDPEDTRPLLRLSAL